jgi:Rho GDP-dissociation inhibitor
MAERGSRSKAVLDSAEFKVQHEILSGLRYVQTFRGGPYNTPTRHQETIGTYAPNTDKNPVYTKRFEEQNAPSYDSMLPRNGWLASCSFVDINNKEKLGFWWAFDVVKDW